jgi:hypothetical protein
MTITARLDTVTTLEANEVRGRLESVTREAIVTGLTGTDWSILTTALDNLGLAAGSQLSSSYPRLKLIGRNPTYAGGKSGNQQVRVRLEYEYEDTTPRFSGGTTIEQTTTQLDVNGDPITLSFTWPADTEAVFPNGKSKASATEVQGGDVPVTVQHSNITAVVVLQTKRPGNVSEGWANHVNSTPWNGGEARQWKCTGVDFEEFDTSQSPPKWRFTFEFEKNSDGWDSTIWFFDPDTNKPVVGAVSGTGYKTPEILPERDFNQFPLS